MIKLKELLDSPHKDVVSLFESPMQLPDAFVPDMLASFGKNISFTAVTKERAKNIGKFKTYDLYEYSFAKSVINTLVSENVTIAFFQYQINNNIVEEDRIWQDSTHFGLCRDFMFDYYLKKYDGLLSDDMHTEAGQKYWDKMIKTALNMNYKVFVLSKEEPVPITNLDDAKKYFLPSGKGLEFKFLIKSK